jgi:hypothetical protein
LRVTNVGGEAMRRFLMAGVALASLLLLAGAAPERTGDDGWCDLSVTLSGWWCPACLKAFECDHVCDGICPDCSGAAEACEICVKRVPDGDRERADVARVVYRCLACGALGDSEGPCVSCDGCGRTVRTCEKSGTAPHVPPTAPETSD